MSCSVDRPNRDDAGAVSLVEGVVGLGIGLLTAKH